GGSGKHFQAVLARRGRKEGRRRPRPRHRQRNHASASRQRQRRRQSGRRRPLHPVISAGASRRLEDRQVHCGRRGTSGNRNAQLSTAPFETDEIERNRGASVAAFAEGKQRRLKSSPLSGTRRFREEKRQRQRWTD